MKIWLAECKRGRNSVEDEHHSGCPKDAASTENVQIVNGMLKEDRRQTIWHIVEPTYIHATTVYRIVSDDLGIKKVPAHWMPRMLTDEQKQNLVDVCTVLFCRLQAQPQIFLDMIVMQDETWIHHFDPERKRRVWCGNTPVLPPLKIQGHPICWESHGYSFLDSKGVIMTAYLSKASTVTGAYYVDELRKLREELKSKRRETLRHGALLHA